MDVKYCQGCGLKVLSTLRFCPACGTRSLSASPPGNVSGTTAQGATTSSPPSIGVPGYPPVQSPPVFAPPPPLATPPLVAAMPVSSFSLPAGTQVGSEPSRFSLFVGAVTKRYFQFSGRARRREYWGFVLFYTLGSFLVQIALLIALLLGGLSEAKLQGVYFLCWTAPLIIPYMAVTVRRLHDVGVSGYLLLVSTVWFWAGLAIAVAMSGKAERRGGEWLVLWGIGFLIFSSVLLYYMLKRGEPGPNRFGPDPKIVAGPNYGFGYFGATTPYPSMPSMAQSSWAGSPSGHGSSPPHYCGQCGHAVNLTLLFCTNCGSRRP